MCGVAGIYAYHYAANPVDVAELRAIRDHMTARGPDGCGEWRSLDRRVALGNRRLAIVDLSERAAQPMTSADGNQVVTYNGEIYNHRELRRELEAAGTRFRTQSDTEVLLHLYAARGPAMVHDLRGMFAFAIWDARKESLLLARDPYGVKPLYYADDGWTFRFASQVKSLLAGGRVSRLPEPAGWAGFLLLGSVPEPFTTYQEIHALPAGATMRVNRLGPSEPEQYFVISKAIKAAERAPPIPPEEIVPRVRAAVTDSVRHHLVADVPVGIFLSGGVDSGALLGLTQALGCEGLRTITLAYEAFRGTPRDEAPGARQAASLYGSRHTTRIVSEAEFHVDLPKIIEAMDQPSIDGINSWFASKAARELGLKVVLSGLGGDELFGGYPSFRDIPRWVRWGAVPSRVPLLGDVIRQFGRSTGLANLTHPKAASFCKYAGTYAGAYLLRRGIFMPAELGGVVDPEFAAEGLRRLDPLRLISEAATPRPRTAMGKVAALEAGLYLRNQLLRDTDWAGMAHSVEVRVPLVDSCLLQQAAPVLLARPLGAGKRLLAESPATALPGNILGRAKTGFETPITDWLQRDHRMQGWRQRRQLLGSRCPWARRWAYQLAAA